MPPDVAHPRQQVDQQGRLAGPHRGDVPEPGADQGHAQVGGLGGPQGAGAPVGGQPGAAAAVGVEQLAGLGVEHRAGHRLPVARAGRGPR